MAYCACHGVIEDHGPRCDCCDANRINRAKRPGFLNRLAKFADQVP